MPHPSKARSGGWRPNGHANNRGRRTQHEVCQLDSHYHHQPGHGRLRPDDGLTRRQVRGLALLIVILFLIQAPRAVLGYFVPLPGIERFARTEDERRQLVEARETHEAQRHTADLGEVLARTEGIAVQRSGGLGSDTRLSLHGLSDDQIRVFLDGVPLELSGFIPNPEYQVSGTYDLEEGFFVDLQYMVVPKGHPGETEVIAALINHALDANVQGKMAEEVWYGPINEQAVLSEKAASSPYIPSPAVIKNRTIKVDAAHLASVREDWIKRYTAAVV